MGEEGGGDAEWDGRGLWATDLDVHFALTELYHDVTISSFCWRVREQGSAILGLQAQTFRGN